MPVRYNTSSEHTHVRHPSNSPTQLRHSPAAVQPTSNSSPYDTPNEDSQPTISNIRRPESPSSRFRRAANQAYAMRLNGGSGGADTLGTHAPPLNNGHTFGSSSPGHGHGGHGYISHSHGNSDPNKPTRWLVTVVPPASLQGEPVMGSTLSTAPPGRFTSGILMPLFPTLYGQLTAIAKEFGLPSTSGLCIYLHVSEPGQAAMNPRISDESWQLLWGHLFIRDDQPPVFPPHHLPIGGQIEFDIDIRKARWYDSWVGRLRRDSLPNDGESVRGE